MARRLLTLSLFAVGLWAVAAVGQPPAAAEKGGFTGKKSDKGDVVPATPAPDAAIEAALANDPDVRMARAKIQLAEAEWAKARQAVTQKVLTLRSLITDQKKAVATAEEGFALLSAGHARGQVSRAELLVAREKLEAAQSALARSETELKLITSGSAATHAGFHFNAVGIKDVSNCAACHVGVGGHAGTASKTLLEAYFAAASNVKAVSGPIPERIRAVLDKPLKLGAKGEKVTFDQAMEAFKKAGLDVPVRIVLSVGPINSLGEELPVGAWLQLFADGTTDTMILVREYGLLVTAKTLGPPSDAVSVFALWKQKLPSGDEKK